MLGYITTSEVDKGIYIDFEGNVGAVPTMLGVLYTDLASNQEVFTQYVLDEAFYPAGDAKEECVNLPINETFSSLAELARADDRRLFAWSTHEQSVVEEYLPDGRTKETILERIVDSHRIARRWKNRFYKDVHFPYITGQGRHRLAEYQKLINYSLPTTATSGNTGQRLSSIRRQLITNNSDYSQLTGVTKSKWTKLLSHNKHDCVSMREVAIRAIKDLGRFKL
jgi:hypothetical protein